MVQPVKRHFDMEFDRFNVEQECSKLIRRVNHWRNGERVGDPNQRDGDGQIGSKKHRYNGCHDHMAREGHKSNKNAYANCG